MSVDPTRTLLLIVGLGEGVTVTDVTARRGGPLVVGVRLMGRPCCGGCGGRVWAHGASRVRLVDLPAFGRPVRLLWTKRRWRCPEGSCEVATFTDQEPRIAPPRARATARAARHATRRAGLGRAISETAAELGCGWHAVTGAVHRWGRVLLDADTERLAGVTALGLDEIGMFRRGRYRRQHWGTTIAGHPTGVLLDIVPGRSAEGATRPIRARSSLWRQQVRWGVTGPVGPLPQDVHRRAAPRPPGR